MEKQYSNNKELIIAILSVSKSYEHNYPLITTKKAIHRLKRHIQ